MENSALFWWTKNRNKQENEEHYNYFLILHDLHTQKLLAKLEQNGVASWYKYAQEKHYSYNRIRLQCASETNHWNSASAQLASTIVQSMSCRYRSKISARPLEIIPDDQ